MIRPQCASCKEAKETGTDHEMQSPIPIVISRTIFAVTFLVLWICSMASNPKAWFMCSVLPFIIFWVDFCLPLLFIIEMESTYRPNLGYLLENEGKALQRTKKVSIFYSALTLFYYFGNYSMVSFIYGLVLLVGQAVNAFVYVPIYKQSLIDFWEARDRATGKDSLRWQKYAFLSNRLTRQEALDLYYSDSENSYKEILMEEQWKRS